MSGIALFENTIEENPNITYFPENNRVVGFGGTIADEGKDPYWGSRNLAESEQFDPVTKRAKYVWDFKTNQAIGQISAVGLMDGKQGNYYGDSIWHPHYSERINMTSYFTTDQAKYMIEWEDDIFTCVRINANKAIIEKYIFDNDKIGLNEQIAHTTLISTQEVELPEDSGGYKSCVWKSNETHYYSLSAYNFR